MFMSYFRFSFLLFVSGFAFSQTYQSKCLNNNASSIYWKETLDVNGENEAFTYFQYLDEFCTQPKLRQVYRGTIKHVGPNETQVGVENVNWTGSQLLHATFSNLDWYNKRKFCGHSDWQVGVERDVTDCLGAYPFFLTVYTIEKKVGNLLWRGPMSLQTKPYGYSPKSRFQELSPNALELVP